MERKPYFPVFLDLSRKKAVVVGAGTIAKRRVKILADYCGEVVLVAPEVNQELLDMEAEGKLKILRKKYEREDLYNADMVFACASDPSINNDIYAACKCLGIPVNVYSDKTKCDFYFPMIVRDGMTVAGVSASGCDRKGARRMIRDIQNTAAQTEKSPKGQNGR